MPATRPSEGVSTVLPRTPYPSSNPPEHTASMEHEQTRLRCKEPVPAAGPLGASGRLCFSIRSGRTRQRRRRACAALPRFTAGTCVKLEHVSLPPDIRSAGLYKVFWLQSDTRYSVNILTDGRSVIIANWNQILHQIICCTVLCHMHRELAPHAGETAWTKTAVGVQSSISQQVLYFFDHFRFMPTYLLPKLAWWVMANASTEPTRKKQTWDSLITIRYLQALLLLCTVQCPGWQA